MPSWLERKARKEGTRARAREGGGRAASASESGGHRTLCMCACTSVGTLAGLYCTVRRYGGLKIVHDSCVWSNHTTSGGHAAVGTKTAVAELGKLDNQSRFVLLDVLFDKPPSMLLQRCISRLARPLPPIIASCARDSDNTCCKVSIRLTLFIKHIQYRVILLSTSTTLLKTMCQLIRSVRPG